MENNSDEVAVTGAFLSLVKALHAARTLYISESAMAQSCGLAAPANHDDRCRELFFNRYRKAVAAIGLLANEQTYEALMRLKVPEQAWHTDFSELPKRYAFNPWFGMGYGGIRQIMSANDSVAAVA